MLACGRCGRSNDDDARFCQACGAPLQPEMPQQERKLISVLFVDIVGSTARADQADPEDVRDRLTLFYDTFRVQTERFGGTVEKFIGDAGVAVFGAPLAHGDDAERAVRCGLATMAAVADLGGTRADLDLRIRGAVCTGEAVVSLGTEHERGEALATGDVLNTAARLQSAAEPGTILVGEETYRATRRSIGYAPVDPIVARGKSEPVPAWVATGEGGAERRGIGPFVGRDRELDILTTVWASAVSHDRPELVTVLGPPGIGKSRLLKEFVEHVEANDGRAIAGRSLPYEEQTGYRTSTEQLKRAGDILETDPPDVSRAKLMVLLTELLPESEAAEIGRYLSLLLGLGLDEPSEDRTPLFFAVRRFVEGLGLQRPTVFVFEDLHWAETSQLDLLEYLSTHVRDVPVAFLALARPELLDTRPTWGGGLRAQTTIPLEPLEPADAAAVAATALGMSSGREATINRLVEVAGGNPLFVEELAASVAEGAHDPEALPSTVREAIASRIDILPAAERSVLLDASVIGKAFWRGVLSSMAKPETLDEALDALEARDLIRHEPGSRVEGDREFSFKHVLIREVAYGTLPRAVRRERHAAVATYLERTLGDNVRDIAWFLAHQWRGAGENGRAASYLATAAEQARSSFAKEEAIALYDEAIELADDPAIGSRFRLDRALSLIELAEFESAAADLDAMIPDLDGPDLIDALLGRARASIWLEQVDEGFEAAERARYLAEAAGDAERIAPAIGYLTGMNTLQGQIDESIARGEEALRRWVPGTRASDFATANEFLADAYYWTGSYERAEELARRATEVGGQTQNVEALLRGGGWRGVSLAAMGRTEEALEVFDGLIETAEKIGRPRFASPSLNYSTLAFRDLYLIDDARRRNEQALELVRHEGQWGMPGMQAEIDLMIADLMEGEFGRTQRDWPRVWGEAINGATWRPWLGGCRLAFVRTELVRQTEGTEETMAAATDALERAQRARRPKYEAAASEALGATLLQMGDASGGVTHLEDAVRLADQLGTPTARWQYRAALGRGRYATGDDAGAETAFQEAAEVIREWTAALSDDHAAGFLQAEPVREVLKAAGSAPGG